MPQLKLTITPNLQKVGKQVSAIKLGAALQDAIKEFAFTVEAEAKKSFTGFTKVPILTGTLRRSINTSIGNLRAVVAPHTNYAIYVHEGRGSSRSYGRRPFMEVGLQGAKRIGFGTTNVFIKELTKQFDKAFK